MSDQPIPQVPEGLKKLTGSYIKRARELESTQPVISYFFLMYTVQIILAKKLHLESPEASDFAVNLLNRIELIKAQFEESSPAIFQLISDNESGFKLVLGFANKIFAKAQKEIDGHTSNKSTAVSLVASCDFYNLLNLWPDYYSVEEEFIDKQRKYAKYHSARILKAFRNGEDPNDYISPEEEAELANLESQQANITSTT
ncbi:unnamed protein product [Ambrosiozyma monospora]|uniref:Unnamed protein product n=1 Tax=Ambrosiozyma monospora TaxID=43982 RepID=A0ACB5U584_AMBMO|nr:unnamed protein product [Ambrosiozyma monospora]